MTRDISTRLRKFSQSCHDRLNARLSAATPVDDSSSSISAIRCRPACRPSTSRITPTSSHITSSSLSRKAVTFPGFWENGAVARAISSSSTASSGSCSACTFWQSCPITSPATPPYTVEFATPLPPSRFEPCAPPASSPATYSPGKSVRVSVSTTTPPIR